MRYYRSVTIHAAHFNEPNYPRWYAIRDQIAKEGQVTGENAQQVQAMLADCHGHNFDCSVTLEAEQTKDEYSNYIISDEAIVETIMEWHGTNLSIHPDFAGVRATTETMAEVLCAKIQKRLLVDAKITARIHETPELYAEHTGFYTAPKGE